MSVFCVEVGFDRNELPSFLTVLFLAIGAEWNGFATEKFSFLSVSANADLVQNLQNEIWKCFCFF